MKRLAVALCALALTACGNDAEQVGTTRLETVGVTRIDMPDMDVYFVCHGTVGIYMAQDGHQSQSSPFAVPNHPECP